MMFRLERGWRRRISRPTPRAVAIGIFVTTTAGLSFVDADRVQAEDLTSSSYRHRAGVFGAIGSGPLASSSSQPSYSVSGVSLGASFEVTPFGRLDSLRSVLPGFFWIQAGGSGSLDLDGDGAAYFLDEDDDGDGLLDLHETGTGFFVSPQNAGTSAVLADTDGDGISDGSEVAGGSDPNDPASGPGLPAVPMLSSLARLALALALVAGGARSLSPRSWRSI